MSMDFIPACGMAADPEGTEYATQSPERLAMPVIQWPAHV